MKGDAMQTEKAIRAIAKEIFASRSRKFRVVEQKTYSLRNYWDGGSREYAVALDLATGRWKMPSELTANPFEAQAHATIEIPQGIGILTHQIFCGQDVGIVLYISPAAKNTPLPPSERQTVESPAIPMAEMMEDIGLEKVAEVRCGHPGEGQVGPWKS
jgi:hypothetical protein